MVRRGISANDFRSDAGAYAWGVAPLCVLLFFGVGVSLDDLGKVDRVLEGEINLGSIGRESIGCQLEPARDALPKVLHELLGRNGIPLADREIDDELRGGINAQANVLRADVPALLHILRLFAVDEAEQLINLDKLKRDVPDTIF